MTKKIKGSTLIEVLVAMIIVMVTFGIAMAIFINVSSSDRHVQKLKAQLLLSEVAIRTKAENSFIDATIELENITLNKTITSYREIPGLNILLLEAFDINGKKVAERKELIIVE